MKSCKFKAIGSVFQTGWHVSYWFS